MFVEEIILQSFESKQNSSAITRSQPNKKSSTKKFKEHMSSRSKKLSQVYLEMILIWKGSSCHRTALEAAKYSA
jgi:hypothetical protein